MTVNTSGQSISTNFDDEEGNPQQPFVSTSTDLPSPITSAIQQSSSTREVYDDSPQVRANSPRCFTAEPREKETNMDA